MKTSSPENPSTEQPTPLSMTKLESLDAQLSEKAEQELWQKTSRITDQFLKTIEQEIGHSHWMGVCNLVVGNTNVREVNVHQLIEALRTAISVGSKSEYTKAFKQKFMDRLDALEKKQAELQSEVDDIRGGQG